jgi:hypothetical protein
VKDRILHPGKTGRIAKPRDEKISSIRERVGVAIRGINSRRAPVLLEIERAKIERRSASKASFVPLRQFPSRFFVDLVRRFFTMRRLWLRTTPFLAGMTAAGGALSNGSKC